MKLPLLVSVPHAGLAVPDEVRPYCVLTPRRIAEDGDEGAAEIYAVENEVRAFVTTDVARAIVDLNRPENDRGPDGAIKTHTCLGVAVWDPPPPEEVFRDLLARYHRPYHERLRQLAGSGAKIGVDCHTMLAVGPPIGPLAGLERPRICLGNLDGKSCPADTFELLAQALEDTFEIEVARNFPFRGGFITRAHAAELPWIQLEISRAPFLTNAEKRARVVRALRSFCTRLA